MGWLLPVVAAERRVRKRARMHSDRFHPRLAGWKGRACDAPDKRPCTNGHKSQNDPVDLIVVRGWLGVGRGGGGLGRRGG